MLCDKCKKNTATIYYKQVVNGVVTEQHLCNACAAEQNNTSFGWHNGYENFWQQFFGFSQPEKVKQPVCSNCGTTYQQFMHDGLLGCSACYDVFRNELIPMLECMHQASVHVSDDILSDNSLDLNENNKDKTDDLILEQSTFVSKEDKLKNKLEKLIKEEKFEEAAIIRDEIKALQEEKKNEK